MLKCVLIQAFYDLSAVILKCVLIQAFYDLSAVLMNCGQKRTLTMRFN